MTRHFALSELRSYLQTHGGSKVVFIDQTGRSETTFEGLLRLVDERLRIIEALAYPSRRRVGLLGENSLSWMAWDLALLLSGNVPLAFLEEHERVEHDALMARYGCEHLILAGQPVSDAVIARSPAASSEPMIIDPAEVLTLAFSSGTTGRTKGLKISCRGLEHILDQFIDAYKLRSDDNYYSFLPFSYFQQRALYLAAIAVGAGIVVAPPSQFLRHFVSERPTYCVNPPAVYEAIHNHFTALEKLGRAVSLRALLGGNTRWMITAMAPIKRKVLDFFWENDVCLYETYGVTETGLVAWNTPDDFKVGTVGKSAADGELMLSGTGEVFVKRASPLALGYFDVSTEDEREVFREDGSVATGDIATMDAEGYVTLVGRSKNAIVTAQGKKFHPEELERELEGKLATHVSVVLGGASVCDNTLLLAPRSVEDSASLSATTVASLVRSLNDSVDAHKRVRAAYVLAEPFSLSNGYATRNLKLDRRKIQEDLLSGRFADQQCRLTGEVPSV